MLLFTVLFFNAVETFMKRFKKIKVSKFKKHKIKSIFCIIYLLISKTNCIAIKYLALFESSKRLDMLLPKTN